MPIANLHFAVFFLPSKQSRQRLARTQWQRPAEQVADWGVQIESQRAVDCGRKIARGDGSGRRVGGVTVGGPVHLPAPNAAPGQCRRCRFGRLLVGTRTSPSSPIFASWEGKAI